MARLATVAQDGQPDVVAVAYDVDGQHFWVSGPGESVTKTRKFRNVRAGNTKVALVMDDLVSFDPFIAREMRVYGVADRRRYITQLHTSTNPTTAITATVMPIREVRRKRIRDDFPPLRESPPP